MSAYELQVVRRTNKDVVASWPPGDDTEKDLVSAIVEPRNRSEHFAEVMR